MSESQPEKQSSADAIRIMRIYSRLMVSGPMHQCIGLSGALQPEYETLLVGGPPEPGEESTLARARRSGVAVEQIPSMHRRLGLFSDLLSLWRLYRLMRQYRPKIVHTHTAKAGALGRLAAFFARVPVRVHTFHGHVFHGYFNRVFSALYVRIERLLARLTTRIIAITPRQYADLTTRYKIAPPNKVELIPLGLNLGRFAEAGNRGVFRAELNLSDDDLLVCIIGRLAPVKQHELLIEAARQLAQSNRLGRVHVAVVGEGVRRDELVQVVQSCGLEDRFHFTGNRSDMEHIYAAADLVVLTSKNEGSPVVLLEAQAAGVPVLATDVGGVADIVMPGGGLIVAPDDAAVFAEAWAELIENPDKLAAMRNQNGPAIQSKYSEARLADDIRALYWKLSG